MKRMSKALSIKLASNATRFAAYCSVMRALRHQRDFLSGGPAVIVLIAPGEEDVEIYEGACKFPAQGESLISRSVYDRERTLVMTVKPEGRKKSERFDLLGITGSNDRIIVVTHSRDLLAENVDAVADAVLVLPVIQPRYLKAAARFCRRQILTDEDASFLAMVPLHVLGAIWRKGRPLDKVLQAARATVTAPKSRLVQGPTLDDLHGLGAAADWGRELAVDLKDWRAGKIGWSEVDRGILLSGQPGSGKTMFAAALARTCGVHLVLGSLARWQAMGHLGDLLKAMRGAFAEGIKNAPSIVLIDEIDSVGDRQTFSGHNAQYSREVVNGLLECLDGSGGREGVVVVGATNFPHLLDAALTRPGRLDRHVNIPLPDMAGRQGILGWHLAEASSALDLTSVAARTDGWTGAALERLARQARRRARRARRDLETVDLLAELPGLVPLPEAMLWRNAIHEAGHVVVGVTLGVGDFRSVEIIDTFDPTGETTQRGGGALFDERVFPERTKAGFLDRIAVALAGLAAEEVVFGSRSAGGGGRKGSDLHVATVTALQVEAAYGLGAGFTFLSGASEEELLVTLHMNGGLQARVENVLSAEFRRAKALVEGMRPELENISAALLRDRRLSAETVEELISRQPRLKLRDGCGSETTAS
ncbi:AAA family ATPase [Mesorhizobium sp. B2-6-4]|uniref:AAA family ATPase n=1 Tax=Mesorhizobium sp. B2-6-4 TaxID=2589913 RepID=UPI00112ABFFF|nr:AAA family ATPase [Mesorhizobium sp. B2-6-4]TPJ54725.1 AAA family ATPase [Mesorhizobium sp. B2-6-4]